MATMIWDERLDKLEKRVDDLTSSVSDLAGVVKDLAAASDKERHSHNTETISVELDGKHLTDIVLNRMAENQERNKK